jgi:hypothetical protein
MDGKDPVEEYIEPLEDLLTAHDWLQDDLQETVETIKTKERELKVMQNRKTFLQQELSEIQDQMAKAQQ